MNIHPRLSHPTSARSPDSVIMLLRFAASIRAAAHFSSSVNIALFAQRPWRLRRQTQRASGECLAQRSTASEESALSRESLPKNRRTKNYCVAPDLRDFLLPTRQTRRLAGLRGAGREEKDVLRVLVVPRRFQSRREETGNELGLGLAGHFHRNPLFPYFKLKGVFGASLCTT